MHEHASYFALRVYFEMSFWYLQFFQKMNIKTQPNYYGISSQIVFVHFLEELKTPCKEAFRNLLTFIKTGNTSWNRKHLTLKLRSHKCLVPYYVFLGLGFRLIGRQYTSAKRHFHNKNGRNFLHYILYLKTKFGMYVKTVKVAESQRVFSISLLHLRNEQTVCLSPFWCK